MKPKQPLQFTDGSTTITPSIVTVPSGSISASGVSIETVSGITVGETVSDGTANGLLKTNTDEQVADATGLTQPSGKTLFITSQAASDEPLTIKGAGSQSGNYLDIVNSSDANVFNVAASGRVTITEGIAGPSGAGAYISFGDVQFGDVTGLGPATIGYNNASGARLRDNGGLAIFLTPGANVASAAAIAPTGNVFHVTGTTNITSITTTDIAPGQVFTMILDGNITVEDGNNLKIAGNLVGGADDTLTLVFDGTNCYEVCRSVN